MKWFPLHIIVKDLSFLIFYFVIMKYNMTNETYLPEAVSNFPGAPRITLISMIGASLFFNIIPLVLSLVTYYPIVYWTKKLFNRNNSLSLITIGFSLTLTTPIIYFALSECKHNCLYLMRAEIISWLLCFVCSIGTYYFLNRSYIYSDKLETELLNEQNG